MLLCFSDGRKRATDAALVVVKTSEDFDHCYFKDNEILMKQTGGAERLKALTNKQLSVSVIFLSD